jgi:hypothetical protein
VVLGLLAPTLIGVLMARAELLDRPWSTARRCADRRDRHPGRPARRPAVRTDGRRLLEPEHGGQLPAGLLHASSGVAAGAGYVALFGLWAAPGGTSGRTGRGRARRDRERSLTCYLWQSLILAPVLSAWGLGLGDDIGTAAAYGLA